MSGLVLDTTAIRDLRTMLDLIGAIDIDALLDEKLVQIRISKCDGGQLFNNDEGNTLYIRLTKEESGLFISGINNAMRMLDEEEKQNEELKTNAGRILNP